MLALGAAGCPSSESGSGKAEVALVDPPEGAAAGGLTVLIQGSNFEGGPASVYFGGEKATDCVVLDDTRIQCVTPPHEIGVVDVEVRSSGNVGRKEFGFEFLPGVESSEPANESGGNDVFAAYERIPIEFDFQGYIGTQADEDIYHLHPPDGGKVFITLTWDESFDSGGIAAMQVEFFQGPDPTPDPEAFFGGSIIGTHDGSGPPPRIEDWMRPSFVVAGAHGPYLRVKAFGDANHAGYDPVIPYTLRIDYESDPTFEPAPQADSFRNAVEVDPSAGAVALTVNAAYDDDFDWVEFTMPADGWARVVLDAGALGTLDTAGELSLGAKLFWVDPSDPDGNHVFSVPGAETSVIDAPGPVARVFESAGLSGLDTYKLRLTNSHDTPMAEYDYGVSVEVGAGGLEDSEPGQLEPADNKTEANDLGLLDVGTPLNAEGYVFHDGDDDWFKFTAPMLGVSATIEWNHTDVSSGVNGIGFYDPVTNPLGGEFRLLVFDQAWYDSGALPNAIETVNGDSYDTTSGTDVKTVGGMPITAGETYYIYLDALRGWSTSESYALTVTLD